jgi:hypothetical protein
MVRLILVTLCKANVLSDMKLQHPVETADSTFANEKWVQRIGFTGDGKNWYTLELNFNFRREAPEGNTPVVEA